LTTNQSESTRVDVLNPSHLPYRRIKKTIAFLRKHIPQDQKILDLGIKNMLSIEMEKRGYEVKNTEGEDLDIHYKHISEVSSDVITAFEIFEHMVAPFNLLNDLPPGKKLIATVPLKVWFKTAHWHPLDTRDRHYHEFEPRQFDMLLDKAGWKILDRELWKTPPGRINGIRPLLRFFVPSYYAVYAIKL
jgi:hypothetical protein